MTTSRSTSWAESAKEIIVQRSADLLEACGWLDRNAEKIARTCHEMAGRFRQGGKLLVFGNGSCSTDAQHVAVEFLHPVIVGKRALPAVALTNDPAALTAVANRAASDSAFAYQVCLLGMPADIAMGISADGNCINVIQALQAARTRGLLTVALCGAQGGTIAQNAIGEFVLIARAEEPLLVKELHMTTYHILWELVHVFFEQYPENR